MIRGFVIILILISSTAMAGNKNREQVKFGVFGTVAGQPFPSGFGVNLGYLPTSFLLLSAGWGFTPGAQSAQTFGGAAKIFLLSSNITPYIGASYSSLMTDGSINFSSFLSSKTAILAGSQSVTALQAGISSIDKTGFFWLVGLSYPLSASLQSIPLPTAAAGYFF